MDIQFCKISESDLETIRQWRMLPEVTKYMYTDPVITIDDQKRWFKKISADDSCRYWLIRVDDNNVGLVNIVDIDLVNKRAGWGYYIASESARGKGIGKNVELNILEYVFNRLGLNKLCCEVFKDNEVVIKIHEKYGSKVEGVRRKHIFKSGEFKDLIEMSILRDEWIDVKDSFVYDKAIIQD